MNFTVNGLFLLLFYQNAAFLLRLIFLNVLIDVIDFIQSSLCNLRDWIITLILSVTWLLFLNASVTKHNSIYPRYHIVVLQTIFITRYNLSIRYFGVTGWLKSWSFAYLTIVLVLVVVVFLTTWVVSSSCSPNLEEWTFHCLAIDLKFWRKMIVIGGELISYLFLCFWWICIILLMIILNLAFIVYKYDFMTIFF